MKHLILGLALLLAAAAPAFADDDGVAVTEADDGTTVDVPSGGTLTLTVGTNGGIPYAWKITSDVAPQLALVNQQTVAVTPGRLGGPANVVFTFSAGDIGETTLTAELLPFGGGDASRSVSITVDVTE